MNFTNTQIAMVIGLNLIKEIQQNYLIGIRAKMIKDMQNGDAENVNVDLSLIAIAKENMAKVDEELDKLEDEIDCEVKTNLIQSGKETPENLLMIKLFGVR